MSGTQVEVVITQSPRVSENTGKSDRVGEKKPNNGKGKKEKRKLEPIPIKTIPFVDPIREKGLPDKIHSPVPPKEGKSSSQTRTRRIKKPSSDSAAKSEMEGSTAHKSSRGKERFKTFNKRGSKPADNEEVCFVKDSGSLLPNASSKIRKGNLAWQPLTGSMNIGFITMI